MFSCDCICVNVYYVFCRFFLLNKDLPNLCLVVNSSDKTVPTQLYPKMMRNFNKLLCYYILDTILYLDKQNYMDFLDSNL